MNILIHYPFTPDQLDAFHSPHALPAGVERSQVEVVRCGDEKASHEAL